MLQNLADLPEDLEYTGEFGPELVLALPFLNWLSLNGLLRDRRIITYKGMRCFYEDLDCREIVEKAGSRIWLPSHERAAWLPVKDEHSFDNFKPSPFHAWPDLRKKFENFPILPDIINPDRPMLIIHNKCDDEWSRGPINSLSIDVLQNIFETFSNRYTIVYIRHGSMKDRDDYVEDHHRSLPCNDSDLLAKYQNVHNFNDLYERHVELGGTQDLNTFKNVLYSRCYHFISSQGGGAHQIALYSGSLLMVLHREGNEIRWVYKDGYYNFMARIPPITMICRNDQQMMQSLPAFVDAPVVNGRVMPRSDIKFIASQLYPNQT